MKRLLISALAICLACNLFGQVPQPAPIDGNDLFKLIGERKTSGYIAKLSVYLGANPSEKGVKIVIVDNICTRIDLYNSDNPWGADIKQFQGKLPMELEFTDNIAQAKQKIGSGFDAGGDVFVNYYITKPFELESKDTCMLTLEYIKGRLITVSMAHIKVAIDSSSGIIPGAPAPPVYGEDFLVMVKKNAYNFEFNKLTQYLGYPSFTDRYTRVYADGGVEVRFNKDKQIEWIYLYTAGISTASGHNMSKYLLPLPYGAIFGESKASLMEKTGTPHGTEGNMIYYNDKYSRVYFQFLGSGLAVVKVGINPDYSITPPPTKKPATNY